MAKILVFQHVAYELLGTLHPLLKNTGFRIKYVNFERTPHFKPNLEGYDGLVVLGGPMNVDQTSDYPHLKTELLVIEEALKRDIPLLGICLGAQLIAKALGATVKKNPVKEIGWYNVHLTEQGKKSDVFSDFEKSEKIFQWHGDTFEIPKSARHLAHSNTCANQAYQYGENVLGFQFHLEVDEAMIHRWLNLPHQMAEMKEAGIDSQKIHEETPKLIERSILLSEKTFGAWIDLFDVKKKRALTHR